MEPKTQHPTPKAEWQKFLAMVIAMHEFIRETEDMQGDFRERAAAAYEPLVLMLIQKHYDVMYDIPEITKAAVRKAAEALADGGVFEAHQLISGLGITGHLVD